MSLRPTDMLQIQSAIDDYEKKFPRRPAPTAEQALAWRFGKREAARFVKDTDYKDEAPARTKRSLLMDEEEGTRIRLGMMVVQLPRLKPSISEDMMPAVRGALRFGWWATVAVGTASVFILGAFVGGFK